MRITGSQLAALRQVAEDRNQAAEIQAASWRELEAMLEEIKHRVMTGDDRALQMRGDIYAELNRRWM